MHEEIAQKNFNVFDIHFRNFHSLLPTDKDKEKLTLETAAKDAEYYDKSVSDKLLKASGDAKAYFEVLQSFKVGNNKEQLAVESAIVIIIIDSGKSLEEIKNNNTDEKKHIQAK